MSLGHWDWVRHPGAPTCLRWTGPAKPGPSPTPAGHPSEGLPQVRGKNGGIRSGWESLKPVQVTLVGRAMPVPVPPRGLQPPGPQQPLLFLLRLWPHCVPGGPLHGPVLPQAVLDESGSTAWAGQGQGPGCPRLLLQHVGTWGTFLPWRPGAPSSPAGGRAAAVGGPPPPSQEGLLSHGPGIKAPGGLSWTPGTSQGPEVASTGGHLAWPHLCRHAPWHGPWQLRWQTWPAWRCYAQGVSVREPACLFLGVCVTVRPLAVWLWVCWACLPCTVAVPGWGTGR